MDWDDYDSWEEDNCAPSDLILTLLSRLQTDATQHRAALEHRCHSYFNGASSSRWRIVFELVRSATYSTALDATIENAQRAFRVAKSSKNSEKEALATQLVPWFSEVEYNIVHILESDISARAGVASLLDDLSEEAAYVYFNEWKLMGPETIHAPLLDEDIQDELIESGLFVDGSKLDLLAYIKWIEFPTLKRLCAEKGISAQRGYSSYRSLLQKPEHKVLRDEVESRLRALTAGNRCYLVPEPTGITRHQLMSLRGRSQMLVSILELIERGRLPPTLI